ncbi:MAG: hypothetical protein R3D33_10015 [Hyphomicrobiaceae bacterium]
MTMKPSVALRAKAGKKARIVGRMLGAVEGMPGKGRRIGDAQCGHHAVEGRFVVEQRRRQRVVADIGNAREFQRRGRMRNRCMALHAAAVQPDEVDLLAAQARGKCHVVGHEAHGAPADAAQCIGDVARHRLVALPGAEIRRLVDDRAPCGLVAAIDDRDARPRQQPRDDRLEIRMNFEVGIACTRPTGGNDRHATRHTRLPRIVTLALMGSLRPKG